MGSTEVIGVSETPPSYTPERFPQGIASIRNETRRLYA
jgi:hypothetical protein